MTKLVAEKKLPKFLLEKASQEGSEYAWPIEVIPEVIEAAQKLKLLNVGGQLQFRIPDVGTCECYWLEVDTYKSVPKTLSWNERIDLAAKAALRDYETLRQEKDFIAEGTEAFSKYIDKYIADGGDINKTMWFVWYLSDEEDGF